MRRYLSRHLSSVLTLGFLLYATATLLAQASTTPPVVDFLPNLTSVASVVVFTIFIVSGLKRVLAKVPTLSDVPLWVYAIVVALGLTALANLYLHTLVGDFKQLAWDAVRNAAAATGIYEWFQNMSKPLDESAAAKATIAAG